MTVEEKIISHAHELGFDLMRITSAAALPDAGSYFKKWLEKGYSADMHYLSRDPERRYTPEKILEGAQSVIMLGVNYFKRNHAFDGGFRIAKYAQGRDYHKVISAMLKKFSGFLSGISNSGPPASSCGKNTISHTEKSAVDFGPLMERAFAAKSHMGFIGKNALIITREYGSYIFLAEIITTLKLAPSTETRWAGSCGTCTRCINVCPTGAILPDRTIDSRLCISYLTIENQGSIPVELRTKIGNWLFGCDMCQDICPHNTRARPTRITDFTNIPIGLQRLSLAKILSIETDEQFTELFAGTPLMRAHRRGLIRNACVVAGNLLARFARNKSSTEQQAITILSHLQRLAESPDGLIAEHARWALSSRTPPSSHQGHGQSHDVPYREVPGSGDRETS
jgi:epoxyqueuosine reductase